MKVKDKIKTKIKAKVAPGATAKKVRLGVAAWDDYERYGFADLGGVPVYRDLTIPADAIEIDE